MGAAVLAFKQLPKIMGLFKKMTCRRKGGRVKRRLGEAQERRGAVLGSPRK